MILYAGSTGGFHGQLFVRFEVSRYGSRCESKWILRVIMSPTWMVSSNVYSNKQAANEKTHMSGSHHIQPFTSSVRSPYRVRSGFVGMLQLVEI